VFVPAASFRYELTTQGLDERATETRTVDSAPFFIGLTEVTNAQYAKFAAARVPAPAPVCCALARFRNGFDAVFESVADASWRAPRGPGSTAPDDHPVVQVSWQDAFAYARWVDLALPTTDQWYTAAAWDPAHRTLQPYPWGDELPSLGMANFRDASCLRAYGGDAARAPDDGFPRTAPVGSFPRDRSACGALDMAGNVGEWTSDAPRAAAGGAETKTFCGWTWSHSPVGLDLRIRTFMLDGYASDVIGFRVVLSMR
jgi:formylglycine-generating enzyme required for sulfatase activity